MPRTILTPEDLSAHFQVPLKTVYVWNSKGTGPRFFRVGKYVRYRQSDVDAWIEARAKDGGRAA